VPVIRLKDSVKPPSLVILAACANVAMIHNLPFDIWITAGSDGKHKAGSRHYDNRALDVRSKNFPTPESKALFLALVLKRLGPAYEGFLEAEGRANEHFHIEVK
jgi:hypothetical protein